MFNAPVAIETYAKVFEEEGALDKLEAFASLNGPKHYRLPPNEETITLEKSAWTAPEEIKVDGPGRARAGLSRRRDDRVEGGERLTSVIPRAMGDVTAHRSWTSCRDDGKGMEDMTGFADKKVMAELTAKMLLEVEAVRFMTDKPFIFTSGWASPVYTDCRRLISFPRVRATLIDFGAATLAARRRLRAVRRRRGRRDRGHSVRRLDGRPAGAADAVCAQEAEGLRPQRADRRPSRADGQRVLLVEDMTTRRPQQGQFLQGAARGRRHGRACASCSSSTTSSRRARKSSSDLGVTLHALATWWDVLEVAKESGKFDAGKLAEVEKFMHDPAGWSKAHGGVGRSAAE